MFVHQIGKEAGIFLHGADFRSVPHDARVGNQPPEILVMQHQAMADIEAFEGRLETRPHGLNDLPVEAGLEDAFRRERQEAVVRRRLQFVRRLRLGKLGLQRRIAALAASGNRPDIIEFAHGGLSQMFQ